MRITRLYIKEYKNLIEFKFVPSALGSQVFIGQNATGKSNLLEALIQIFRHLDLDETPPFDYELEYNCKGCSIEIICEDLTPVIKVKEGTSRKKKVKSKDFAEKAVLYLPDHIFAYYSGRNERMEQHFFEHQRRQFESYRGVLVENEGIPGDSRLVVEDVPLRRLFYCQNIHSQLILLSYLIDLERAPDSEKMDKELEVLKKELKITELESALFVLKKPRDYDNSEEDSELAQEAEAVAEKGDSRFWGASGIIEDFLSKLWDQALAPIDEDLLKLIDFRGHEENQETLYLYLDRARLKDAAEEIGDVNIFFRQLEAVFMAGYLDEVRIQVKREDIEKPIFIRELSEGEQQLMTILGLMKFTRHDESLFLLDEPDTHLNPIWKYNYFGLIDHVLDKEQEYREKNQLFLTTHDPLMLGTLLKEQVNVLSKSYDGTTAVEHPYQDPRGMGFSNLLRSEMFGLRSTIDLKTLEDLERRNELLAERSKSTLSDDGKQELEDLQKRLEELGFGRETRDPMFQLFIEQMYQAKRLPLTELLTKEQMQEQEEAANEIIKKLIHQEKMGQLNEMGQAILAEYREG